MRLPSLTSGTPGAFCGPQVASVSRTWSGGYSPTAAAIQGPTAEGRARGGSGRSAAFDRGPVLSAPSERPLSPCSHFLKLPVAGCSPPTCLLPSIDRGPLPSFLYTDCLCSEPSQRGLHHGCRHSWPSASQRDGCEKGMQQLMHLLHAVGRRVAFCDRSNRAASVSWVRVFVMATGHGIGWFWNTHTPASQRAHQARQRV